jgi:hypothetical protein
MMPPKPETPFVISGEVTVGDTPSLETTHRYTVTNIKAYTEAQLDTYGRQCIEACITLVEPDEEHRHDASWGYLGGKEGVELLDGIVKRIRNMLKGETE